MSVNTNAQQAQTNAVDAEILRLLYAQAPAILAASVGVGLIAFAVLFQRAAIWPISLWATVLLVVTALRFGWVKYAQRALGQRQYYLIHRRVFLVGTVAAGFTWGSLSWVAPMASDSFSLLFITFVIGGMVAGCLGSLGIDRLTYASFAVPATLLTGLAAAQVPSDLGLACAVLVIIFCMTQLAYSSVVRSNMRTSIALRFENADLVARLRLETENTHAAIASKQRFLSAAQHDMRQPAFALKLQQTYLATIAQRGKNLSAPELADFAQKLDAPIEIISSLLEQLLELSRLDALPKNITVESVSLNALLNTTCDLFATHAQTLGLRLRTVPTSVYVMTDAAALKRVLHNLVANGLRYTSAGGVVLGVHHKQNGVEIWVVDSGIGIAPQDRQEIFKEFTQIRKPGNPSPLNASGQGFGLGLAIVSQICARLGLSVSVTSKLGKGSRFAVVVPQAACLPTKK